MVSSDATRRTNLVLVAEAMQTLLKGASIPTEDLPAIAAAFHEILAGPAATAEPPAALPLPKKARAVPGPAKPRQVRAVPATPLEQLAGMLRRKPMRLDDQAAMAVARASGKAVGRDRLERLEQRDGLLFLTFGFEFGSAKFTVQFDPLGAQGQTAVAALIALLPQD
jgi:hypothetical protein